jgi:hypothetical protein
MRCEENDKISRNQRLVAKCRRPGQCSIAHDSFGENLHCDKVQHGPLLCEESVQFATEGMRHEPVEGGAVWLGESEVAHVLGRSGGTQAKVGVQFQDPAA